MTVEDILDRFESPLRRGSLACPPARCASASNPRCGDVVSMYATLDDDRLTRVTFDGSGCTISQAAADVVAELAEGQPLERVRALRLTDVLERLGPDTVRTRLDCAVLGLRTLQSALEPDSV